MAILSGIILIIQIYFHQKNNSDKNFKLFALNNYYGLSVFITLIDNCNLWLKIKNF